jgi:hypothetical protein
LGRGLEQRAEGKEHGIKQEIAEVPIER